MAGVFFHLQYILFEFQKMCALILTKLTIIVNDWNVHLCVVYDLQHTLQFGV